MSGLVCNSTHSLGCVLGSVEKALVGLIVLPAPATRIPPPVTISPLSHLARETLDRPAWRRRIFFFIHPSTLLMSLLIIYVTQSQ